MVDVVFERTQNFIQEMPKSLRKDYGQFFTSVSSAEYMASLSSPNFNKASIRILDAGAGSGMLSIALLKSLRSRGYEGELLLTCYETDENVLPLLTRNLVEASAIYHFTFEIIGENYITSQSLTYPTDIGFDIIIGNPPYKKISKDADEAKSMPEVCHGAPNLYFLFWTMGIHNLNSDGELIYIIPRSWTSGAYFEKFRQYLLQNSTITNIHLFGSRDKVFDGESVLQETMIIKVVKGAGKTTEVKISFSETCNLSNIHTTSISYGTIVGNNGYIYLPINESEINVLNLVNSQHHTLISEGLRMRTGLVVDFRTREALRDDYEEEAFPIFYPQHIKNGRVQFPIGKESEYILTQRKSLLQKNTNYVFVKRFTAKEENRRLQCGILLKTDYPQYSHISTDNKINFIECATREEAYGIFAIFNSTLYDSYYRILNGSTQVNSTEINNMPIPNRDTIANIGKELLRMELTEENCDNILKKWIK